MSKKDLILVGAGGHAKSCVEVIESTGEYSVAQIVGQAKDLGKQILGHEVRYTDNNLVELKEKYDFALVGIGQIQNSETRIRLFMTLSELGFSLPTIISKSAVISKHARIGKGTIVMHGATLNADCVIGENVILNSSALIEHDSFVGNHCHVATRVTVNGGSKIGEGTFLGSGTVVRNGIEIGANSFIGMGSIITESLPSSSIYKRNI